MNPFAHLVAYAKSAAKKQSRNYIKETYTVQYINEEPHVKISHFKPLAKNQIPKSDVQDITPLEIYPKKVKHFLWGFGGNITDACMANIDKLPENAKYTFFTKVFSPQNGAGLSILRIPISGNDFSEEQYTLDDYDPKKESRPDYLLKRMNFKFLDPFIEFARRAKLANPELHILVTAWTAPAWMKDDNEHRRNKLFGGQIKKEHFPHYAKYLYKTVKYIEEHDLKVDFLTVLNEPLIGEAKESWYFEGNFMSVPDQVDFTVNYLKPLFSKNNLSTNILAHDHNWDNAGEVVQNIQTNEAFSDAIGGVAYHCYGGDFGTLYNSLIKHPNHPGLNTECTGQLREHHEGYWYDFQWWMQTQSVDAVRAGTAGAIGWNLCLDNHGGPPPPGKSGCHNCRGMVALDPNASIDHMIYENPEFKALAQVSRYTTVGTKVIESDDTAPTQIPNVAFKNPNGDYVIVVRNPTSMDRTVEVKYKSKTLGFVVVPSSGAITVLIGK